MRHRHLYTGAALCLAIILTGGCGGEGDGGTTSTGDVQMSVAANQAVRMGFPHEENGQTLAFVDGWTFTVDAFAVSIGEVRLSEPVAEGTGEMLARWEESSLVDVTSEEDGDVTLGMLEQVPARRVDVGFTLVGAGETSTLLGASEDDAQRMRENGWSMLLRGTATPTDANDTYTEPVTLELGIPIEAEYYDCINGVDGTKGLAVAADSVTEAYIYPHIVHFFWDSLGAGNEDLRFDPMAAVANMDNVVTLDALAARDLTELTGPDGVPLYDDAGLLTEYNLARFIERAALESMHFNGIGFCKKRLQ